MRHFEPGPAEATLDVEPLVRFGAIEDGLVAANLLGNVVKGLNDPQAELLPLLVLRDGDVFDVANEAEIVDAERGRMLAKSSRALTFGEARTVPGAPDVQFPFDYECTCPDYPLSAICDAQQKVFAIPALEPVIPLVKLLF